MTFIKYSSFFNRYLNCYLNNGSTAFIRLFPVNKYPSNIRFFHGQTNPKVEMKLKKKDSVSDEFHIIYRAPYEAYCKMCYSLTLFSTTIIPTVYSAQLFTHGFNQFPLMLANIELAKSNTDLIIFSVGLLLVMTQLCYVLFRYPYRIYKQSCGDKYIMIYQHILPWRNTKEELLAGDLKKTERSLMPWNDSMYEFRTRKAILLFDYFHKPIDLELMMKKDNVKS